MRQRTTEMLIFSIDNIVNFVSGQMTLEQEDVSSSGRPGAMPPMNAGDPHKIEIERIGVLRNRVVVERH